MKSNWITVPKHFAIPQYLVIVKRQLRLKYLSCSRFGYRERNKKWFYLNPWLVNPWIKWHFTNLINASRDVIPEANGSLYMWFSPFILCNDVSHSLNILFDFVAHSVLFPKLKFLFFISIGKQFIFEYFEIGNTEENIEKKKWNRRKLQIVIYKTEN